ERPEVQQRLELGWRVEIAGLAPQLQVRQERRAAGDVLQQFAVLVLHEHEPSGDPAPDQHHGESREDPANAARVEMTEREGAVHQLAEDDAGNHKSGNHEEDADADKPAGHQPRRGMKPDHRQHGNRAQPVDVGPIGQTRRRHGPRPRLARVVDGDHQMTSAKYLSIRLKVPNAAANSASVSAVATAVRPTSGGRLNTSEARMPSTIALSGLSTNSHLKRGGTAASGYATGARYSHSCSANCTTRLTSRA